MSVMLDEEATRAVEGATFRANELVNEAQEQFNGFINQSINTLKKGFGELFEENKDNVEFLNKAKDWFMEIFNAIIEALKNFFSSVGKMLGISSDKEADKKVPVELKDLSSPADEKQEAAPKQEKGMVEQIKSFVTGAAEQVRAFFFGEKADPDDEERPIPTGKETVKEYQQYATTIMDGGQHLVAGTMQSLQQGMPPMGMHHQQQIQATFNYIGQHMTGVVHELNHELESNIKSIAEHIPQQQAVKSPASTRKEKRPSRANNTYYDLASPRVRQEENIKDTPQKVNQTAKPGDHYEKATAGFKNRLQQALETRDLKETASNKINAFIQSPDIAEESRKEYQTQFDNIKNYYRDDPQALAKSVAHLAKGIEMDQAVIKEYNASTMNPAEATKALQEANKQLEEKISAIEDPVVRADFMSKAKDIHDSYQEDPKKLAIMTKEIINNFDQMKTNLRENRDILAAQPVVKAVAVPEPTKVEKQSNNEGIMPPILTKANETQSALPPKSIESGSEVAAAKTDSKPQFSAMSDGATRITLTTDTPSKKPAPSSSVEKTAAETPVREAPKR